MHAVAHLPLGAPGHRRQSSGLLRSPAVAQAREEELVVRQLKQFGRQRTPPIGDCLAILSAARAAAVGRLIPRCCNISKAVVTPLSLKPTITAAYSPPSLQRACAGRGAGCRPAAAAGPAGAHLYQALGLRAECRTPASQPRLERMHRCKGQIQYVTQFLVCQHSQLSGSLRTVSSNGGCGGERRW